MLYKKNNVPLRKYQMLYILKFQATSQHMCSAIDKLHSRQREMKGE